MRQYSARLELFRQLAGQLYPNATSCCFADVGGELVADAAALGAALEAAAARDASSSGGGSGGAPSTRLYEFDHVFNPQQQGAPGALTAILYGPPGAGCFRQMDAALRAAARESESADGAVGKRRPVVYAHRPLLGDACRAAGGGDGDDGAAPACLLVGAEEQLVLPGYGVEAALKDTEYSAMDDKQRAQEREAAAAAADKKKKQKQGAAGDDAAAAAADADADADEAAAVAALGEVKGFRLDVLARRRPDKRQELLTFRDALLASEDDDSGGAIKVWDLKDAGLQAAARVGRAADPLALLQEISQVRV